MGGPFIEGIAQNGGETGISRRAGSWHEKVKEKIFLAPRLQQVLWRLASWRSREEEPACHRAMCALCRHDPFDSLMPVSELSRAPAVRPRTQSTSPSPSPSLLRRGADEETSDARHKGESIHSLTRGAAVTRATRHQERSERILPKSSQG